MRAFRVAGLSRAAYYAPPQDRVERDAPVIEALTAVAAAHPGWGFWKCFGRLRLVGHAWNAKRVYRVYRALRLNRPRRAKRRIPRRPLQPLLAPAALNVTWAVDFMGDTRAHALRTTGGASAHSTSSTKATARRSRWRWAPRCRAPAW